MLYGLHFHLVWWVLSLTISVEKQNTQSLRKSGLGKKKKKKKKKKKEERDAAVAPVFLFT